MGTISVSVNEKLCKTCMTAADASLDKVKKIMGTTGDKGSTVVGAVEKMNQGFRDTKEVAKLYKDFNTAAAKLASELKAIDSGFQAIDKAV